MASLQDVADKEGEVSPTEHGSTPLAVALCRSQNLAEQGRYAEAASVLSKAKQGGGEPISSERLQMRIEILNKWAAVGLVDIHDFSRFYFETGPFWFQRRTRPIVALWRNKQIAEKDKLPLIATAFQRQENTKGVALAFQRLADLPNVDHTTSMGALLGAGDAFYELGDFARAEQAWLKVIASPPKTPDWPKAMFNLGLLEEKKKHYPGAISDFEAVLNSHPNDKEPGSNIMETNRNYSHRSAWEISRCYEGIGKYDEALRWAQLAKTHYPFYSWCGTCQQGESMAVNKRIAYLAAIRFEYRFLTAAGFTGSLIFLVVWFRRKKTPSTNHA